MNLVNSSELTEKNKNHNNARFNNIWEKMIPLMNLRLMNQPLNIN